MILTTGNYVAEPPNGSPPKDPHSAWQRACAQGQMDELDRLAQGKPWQDLVSETPSASSLMLAVDRGHAAVAKRLLLDGANANYANKNGYTPLLAAICGGYEDIVLDLLAHGADPTQADKDGTTPLMQAAQGGHETMVAKLLEAGASKAIGAHDSNGNFALLCAVFSGQASIARLLMEQGAEPDQEERPNKDATHIGERPMYYAILQGDAPMVSLLIEKGANVFATTSMNDSYLHRAIANRRLEVLTPLLDAGLNPDAPDNQGKTARELVHSMGRGAWFDQFVAQHQAKALEGTTVDSKGVRGVRL